MTTPYFGEEQVKDVKDGKDWGRIYDTIKKDSKNYFKPQGGKRYAVTFLDEGTAPYKDRIGDKEVMMVDFKVGVNGEGLVWSIPTGGKNSRYGMMARVFKEVGQATGVTLHISVDGDGQDRKYTIQEYTDLLFKEDGGAC